MLLLIGYYSKGIVKPSHHAFIYHISMKSITYIKTPIICLFLTSLLYNMYYYYVDCSIWKSMSDNV